MLQAALRHAKAERLVSTIYDVSLPPAGAPRDRDLTRQEAAWQLLAAAPHLRRFIFKDPERAETKERRGSVAAPRQLMAQARRWKRLGGSHPIEWRGAPVAEIDTAFHATCRHAETLAAKHAITLDLSDVSPHTLKHTAVCWAFQKGMTMEDATS